RHGIFPLADNRLLHWRNLWNQYDGQGNLTRRREGATEQYYQYDADNRLVAARGRGPQGEFVARYGYDALGRRTGKTVTWCESGKQEETHFLWEGYRLLQVRQPDRKESYVYDPTVWWSPLARITQQSGSREGDIRWFITDRNGAPLEMTDADGSVRWSGDYGSFGRLLGQTQDSEGLRDGKTVEPQPLRYAGQYADDETGLHYNLFRYYDPTVGRFTTQDPIGLAGGINLYQYAPNPLSWVDPFGLTGTYIFTDEVTSYIGKGPESRMNSSMNYRIGGKSNATQFAHMDFGDNKLGFMVEHRLMEKYNARYSPDFANSERINSPGKKLYDAADAKTQKKVDQLANKLDEKFKASKKSKSSKASTC
ncbi:RHS repeat domain-containing protein, partial [Dickeya solani]